jgi:CRISPR/Cas system-associated protein Cas5 (RAMP superfamily)
MNLIDRLSIISPEDAKRLKACDLDTKTVNAFITNIKQSNIRIDRARVEIRKSIEFIKSATRSKRIKKQLEYVFIRLNEMTQESNHQYNLAMDLDELLGNHSHDLILATYVDYDKHSLEDINAQHN